MVEIHQVTPYVGLMLVILSPELDLTNSLLMKRPIGCLYSRPLGAFSWTNTSVSDILMVFLIERGVMKRKELIGT